MSEVLVNSFGGIERCQREHGCNSQAAATRTGTPAQLHEAWCENRRKLKGDDLPNPRWKKITESEFLDWCTTVPYEKLREMYKYAPVDNGGPDLKWFGENVTGDLKEACYSREEHCRNWIDINQPYNYLPPSWRKENLDQAIQCIQILGDVQFNEPSKQFQ